MKLFLNITTLKYCVFLLLFPVLLSACNKLDDQLAEQSKITGQAQADETVIATNNDLAARSSAAEADLQQKQKFYQGVSGRFEGLIQLRDGQEKRQVHVEIAATVPPYKSTRVRALEEVISDLNNLQLVVRVSQLAESGAKAACIFTGVRPDMHAGSIILLDPNCANSFELFLSKSFGQNSKAELDGGGSIEVANQLQQGAISQVDNFFVDMDPSAAVGIWQASVSRTNNSFNW